MFSKEQLILLYNGLEASAGDTLTSSNFEANLAYICLRFMFRHEKKYTRGEINYINQIKDSARIKPADNSWKGVASRTGGHGATYDTNSRYYQATENMLLANTQGVGAALHVLQFPFTYEMRSIASTISVLKGMAEGMSDTVEPASSGTTCSSAPLLPPVEEAFSKSMYPALPGVLKSPEIDTHALGEIVGVIFKELTSMMVNKNYGWSGSSRIKDILKNIQKIAKMKEEGETSALNVPTVELHMHKALATYLQDEMAYLPSTPYLTGIINSYVTLLGLPLRTYH